MSAPALPLRIGALGAARITPLALIRPAKKVPDAVVVAVAARDPERARAFAMKHGITRVHPTYDALVADPEIDAVYNPLPNSLHAEWSIKALRAGKHVLCEKPMAANADEAERMAAVANSTGRLLIEAFHYRYHPLAARMKAIIGAGELGTLRHVETHLCIPLFRPGDIRYRYDLAGGATMDVGCYTIHLMRFLVGAEPQVIGAQAALAAPQVDRWMSAKFRFADGCTARITCSLLSAVLLRASVVVRGDRGQLRVLNPYFPQFPHRLTLRTRDRKVAERVSGDPTYTHQLRAFVNACRNGTPLPTTADDAIANMRVIDAVYEAAGLKKRGG